MNPKDLLTLALVAGGGYLLYKLWGTVAQVGSAAAAAEKSAVTSAAQAYVGMTSGPAMQATGMVVLPDGSSVPVSQLNIQPVAGTNSASVSYMGSQYYLNAPSESDGNWYAESTLNTDIWSGVPTF